MDDESGRRKVWSEHQRTKMALMQHYEDFLLSFNKCMICMRTRGYVHKKYLAEAEGALSMVHSIGEVTHALRSLDYIQSYFDGEIIGNDVDYIDLEKRNFYYGQIGDQGDKFLALKKIKKVLVQDMRKSDIFNVTVQEDTRPAIVRQADDETT